ncbi:retrovirus-related pol polyprotein from transposon TNT 1-94 [Tanacetum coccineum]
MSSECNNIKFAIRNDKFEVVCAMCNQCLITANHDVCVLNYVIGMNSCDNNQSENVSNNEKHKKHKPKVKKPKKSGSKERLASPRPRKPRTCLRWSPTGRIFYHSGKIVESSDSECKFDSFVCDDANASNPPGTYKQTVSKFHFFSCLWVLFDLVMIMLLHSWVMEIFNGGNILIARVYFIEGLVNNLFSVRQFCDSDLEVAGKRNTCFIRNLEGVDLLKRNYTRNLYTINIYEMASASPICLMVRDTSTKSWLWHQRLSYLNFDTINKLAKNDLVTGLLKFKYTKEHLCPSCEQGKSKKAPHKQKPVPNSKQRLHLFSYGFVWANESQKYKWEAAKAIATACYTQNCSQIHQRFDKTPYKLINGRKPDISICGFVEHAYLSRSLSFLCVFVCNFHLIIPFFTTENADPFVHVQPNGLHVRITQELNKLHAISSMINSHLEQPLNDFISLHNIIEMDDLELDNQSVDTPLVSPFSDSDDSEVLNDLHKYGIAGNFYLNRIITSLDGEDLAFPSGKAKRRNSGTKMKTLEEKSYLLLYAISSKEDTAYQRPDHHQELRVIIIPILRIKKTFLTTITPILHSCPVISQRSTVNVIDGN